MTEHPAEAREDRDTTRATRLFDIRRIIAALFLLYGVLVTGAGLLDGAAAETKAGGVDLNLWSGLGMLALGASFLLWHLKRPLGLGEEPAAEAADRPAAPAGRDEPGR